MTLVRRIGSVTAAVLLAAVFLCADAFASMATKARIALDQRDGLAGGVVNGHGSGFDHWATDGVRRPPLQPPLNSVWTNADYVQIHWNSLDGAVVWEGAPDSSGRIGFQFSVPADAAPGDYTVVATQTGYDGKPTGGTPTRAAFRVLLAPSSSRDAAPAPPPSPGRSGERGAAQRPAAAPREPARPNRNATSSPTGAPRAGAAGASAASIAAAPSPRTAGGRPTAPRARAASRSARTPAHVPLTRRQTPGAEPTPAARRAPAAATATPRSDGGGVPLHLLALAGLLVALAGAAGTCATRLRVRWSPVLPTGKPPPVSHADESPAATPDAIERELRELLEQYEDDRVPEPAAQR